MAGALLATTDLAALLGHAAPAKADTGGQTASVDLSGLDIQGRPKLDPGLVPTTALTPAWSSLPLFVAQAQPQPAAAVGTINLDTISVEGASKPTSTMGPPPAPFAGGQVATGGDLGLLGNKSVFDTPFSQNNYTEELIRNQQAQTVQDVLDNDSSVRAINSRYGLQDELFIRGFFVNSRDFAFDGLYGITDLRRPEIEGIERVEVLHGPGALLFGFPPGGAIGGVVNFVPKRAPDEPLTRVTADYLSDANGGGTFDVARRFGQDNAVGVRINGSYHDGDTPIDHQSQENATFTAGLDYRGDRVRLSADLGYQDLNYRAPTEDFSVLPGFAIPKAPDLTKNIEQPWETTNFNHMFAAVRGEFDITSDLTAFAAYGASRVTTKYFTNFPTITNAAGDVQFFTIPYKDFADQQTVEAGLRGRFDTGPVHHAVSLVGTGYWETQGFADIFFNPFNSNIYNPVIVPAPVTFTVSTNGFKAALERTTQLSH